MIPSTPLEQNLSFDILILQFNVGVNHMLVEGSNGSVTLDTESVRIKHKGLANLLTAGAHGEKSIPIANITAVQFKAAGWIAGYIQFTLLGGLDRPGGAMEATKDENAVLFTKEQQPNFEALKAEVEKRMQQLRQAPPTAALSASAVDELERLASLVDRGFLSREEFETKKRRILEI